MKILARLILFSIANAIALIITDKLIPGISITNNIQAFFSLSIGLAFINLTIKPILKFFFSPLIVLTIGLFTIIINAFLLYLLDFLNSNLKINTLTDLVMATLIIGFINLLVIWSARKSY